MNHAEADKLQRLKLDIYRIAALAVHELQCNIHNDEHRRVMAALRAIQDLTEE